MPRDLTGQLLDGRYRVGTPLGEGGMGSVYRGEHLKLGRAVAIKVLNEEFPNASSRERFEREAMAMAKLEHPNCASVLDVGVHEGSPYVVMELVSGQTLRDMLVAGALPIARAVEITRQVLSGLAHAHEHGIIHRDIKPANIVVAQKAGVGDLVKILDFGLARFRNVSSNLTGAMVIGTPEYISPEQVVGGDLDHRVDLYACGVLLFELLTGTKPFGGGEPIAICMQHVNVEPPRLSERAPNARSFGDLEAVVARALEKRREDRFASAEDFTRALVEAAAKLDSTAPTPPALEPTQLLSVERPAPSASLPLPAKKRRAPLVIGALGALAVAAIAVVVATRSDAKPPPPAPAPAPVVVEAPPKEAPAPSTDDATLPIVTRALELSASGRRQAAIEMLLDARKTYPKDARLAYHASKLYLEKMWWADGLKLARIAIDLDSKYRTDDELIKLVVKGFNTTASMDWTLAKFLREDIGAAAKPYLEDTAKGHPNPIVRKRAQRELRHYN